MAGELVVRELLTQLGVEADVRSVQLFGAAVNNVKQSMGQAVGVGQSFSVAIGTLVANAVQRGAGMLLGLARGLLSSNFEAERLNASLQTITGSEEAANAAFSQISDFAATTPFSLGNVTEAWIKLANVGIEPTAEVMNSVGNTAAAFGKDITDFAGAAVAATTGEMERLKEFGIVAKQAGNTVEFTFRGVKTKIKKDSASIQKYLFALGNNQFAGALDRQIATLPGLFSNLKDNISLFFLTMGKKGGLNDALKTLIRTLIGVTAEGEPLAVMLGRIMARQVDRLTNTILWLRKHSDDVLSVLKKLGIVLAVLGTRQIIKVVKGFSVFSSGLKELGGALTGPTLKFTLMAAAVLLLMLAVEDIIGFMQGKDSLIGSLLSPGDANKLRASITKIVNSFTSAFEGVQRALGKWDISVLDLVTAAISIAVLMVAEFIQLLVTVGDYIGYIAAWNVIFWSETFPAALGDTWDAVVTWLGDLWDGFTTMMGDIGTWMTGKWTGMIDGIGNIWKGLVGLVQDWVINPIEKAWDATIGFITGLIDKLVKKATDSFGAVLGAGEKVMNMLGLTDGVSITSIVSKSVADTQARAGANTAASLILQGLTVIVPGDTGPLSNGDIGRGVSGGVKDGLNQALRDAQSSLFSW